MVELRDETILALAAMVCGIIWGYICLSHGVNHVVAFAIAAGIFGVAGYELKAWMVKRQIEE